MSAEQPSFNQLTEQQNSGHKDMTVLVERSGNKISTGHYTGERNEKGDYIVDVTTADGQEGYREVGADALSDAKQAELAEALAGKPLRSLGHEAIGAAGIEEPAAELTQLDKLLDKMPLLRQFESELKQIAALRDREESAGYRHGMSQFDSSERMIDDLVDRMHQIQKAKIGEDRKGAILRYINLQ